MYDIQETLNFHEMANTTDSDEYRDASRVFYDRHLTREEAKRKGTRDGAPWNQVIIYMGLTEFQQLAI